MKVSIITVCRNAESSIEQTIKSVILQDYKNIEYIIIDGKSTDKTLSIINKYKKNINKVVSEQDRGIYYAMNKGIDKATGDIIYFLNSGDLLFDEKVITNIIALLKNKNADIIYGDILLYDNANPKKKIIICVKNVNRIYLARDGIYHQAMFVKKNLFYKYGKFNTTFKLLADYEWTLRILIQNNLSIIKIDKIIAKYLIGGKSAGYKKTWIERFQILHLYFTFTEIFLVGIIYWIIYHVILKIKRKYFLKE